jgi:hypothetical protein
MPGLIVYRWAFFHLLYVSTLHIPDVGPKFARAPGHRSSCPRPKPPCQHPTKRVRSGRMHPGPFYFTPNTRHTHTHTYSNRRRSRSTIFPPHSLPHKPSSPYAPPALCSLWPRVAAPSVSVWPPRSPWPPRCPHHHPILTAAPRIHPHSHVRQLVLTTSPVFFN